MKCAIICLSSIYVLFSMSVRGQDATQEKPDSTSKTDTIKIDRLDNPRWREEQMHRRNINITVITEEGGSEGEESIRISCGDCTVSCCHNHRWKFFRSRTEDGKITWRGGHWTGFGIGYSGLIERFGRFSLPDDARFMAQRPRSIAVTINLFDYALVRGRTTALITGIGFEFNNFRFDRNITLTQENGRIVPDYTFDEAGIRLRKSKLTTGYFNVPLLYEIQFGKDKRGFINFGAIGGVRICGHTKVRLNASGFPRRIKQDNGLNLRNFHYGVAIHGGYRSMALTMQYYPHSIFRRDEGPDVQQINIGVAIML